MNHCTALHSPEKFTIHEEAEQKCEAGNVASHSVSLSSILDVLEDQPTKCSAGPPSSSHNGNKLFPKLYDIVIRLIEYLSYFKYYHSCDSVKISTHKLP